MKIEANLQDNEARIVYGVRGVKSTSFSKKFQNAAKMEAWLDDQEGAIEIFEISRP